MSAFETFGVDADAPRDAKFECGVCWRVYDPAEGDAVWQVSAGTAFVDLPEEWTCPNCDAPKARFMALGVETRG
ncbi:MAG: rubredoxin [Hyphomicrobiales bacterium]|nr:rubredoxin [Hyphomicrobiales bacterium]